MALLFFFLASALDEGRGKRHAPASLPPGMTGTGAHCKGGWVGPTAGLDRCGKSRPNRDYIRFADRPSRCELLYQLR